MEKIILSSLAQPVFNLQARHTPKFGFVVCDQRCAQGQGVCGDEGVVGANRCAGFLQLRADIGVVRHAILAKGLRRY